jgi:DNA-binding transcriptional regulator YdaS (Cro superfamily)
MEGLDMVEFAYAYDLTMFFERYDFLNQSKIAAIAGLHPSLIRQYSSGHKYPSREQVQKIEQAIRSLGKSMQNVRLASKQATNQPKVSKRSIVKTHG